MASPPFPTNSGQSSYPPGFGPEQSPDNPSGQTAPAGSFFAGDWPVTERHASSASTGGYRANPSQQPLPAPGSRDGFPVMPGAD